MPSTLVHVAVGALVGTALLAERFGPRPLLAVCGAAAVPDIDTFVGLVIGGAHRSLLHSLLLPALLAGLLYADTRLRDRSLVRERWGTRGVHVAWAALAALLCGGILPDLFTNGVNAFYPLHDQFYTIDGTLKLSNQRGIVQTFVEVNPEEPARTTENVHYRTGVDTAAGEDPPNAERVFPVVRAGWQLMLVAISAFVVGTRWWETARTADD